MNAYDVRWVLAFDGSCGACRRISDAVFDVCDGKLEALPLAHFEVARWRSLCGRSPARWAPTLFRVQGPQVRSWTGARMAVALVGRLGIRSTLRVLRALGELRGGGAAPLDPRRMGRAQFLRLASGAAVAAGLLVKGVAPAWAEGENAASARAWVRANMDRLPVDYHDLTARPIAYRQAIYEALVPAQRSRLWVAHVRRFRAAHPVLTGDQAAVVDQAEVVAGRVSVFEQGARSTELPALRDAATRAFGPHQAAALLATLGPTTAAPRSRPECQCNTVHVYCWNTCRRDMNNCVRSNIGCGTFYAYPCDGMCVG